MQAHLLMGLFFIQKDLVNSNGLIVFFWNEPPVGNLIG